MKMKYKPMLAYPVSKKPIDYEYYIWGDTGKDIWISIFDGDECIFVGKPDKLQTKYGK